MRLVLDAANEMGEELEFPFEYLEQLIKEKRRVDQLIVLADRHIAPGYEEMEGSSPASTGGISRILKKYRQEVNPDLLYVSVNLSRPKVLTFSSLCV
jgi:hypothetical protein